MRARLITEIGVITYLRRYSNDAQSLERKACPGPYGWHNASVEVARGGPRVEGYITIPDGPAEYAGDPRWPTCCEYCPYVFAEGDEWQVMRRRLFDTASGKPEVGDLFWAPGWKDGTYHLTGICPNASVWNIDGPSSNGPGWTRTGEPPNITVTPSIWIQIAGPRGYHGFLQGGEWTPDLEGRTYPAVKEAIDY